jgi:Phospholipid-translocating P-type ATPase C-terminal
MCVLVCYMFYKNIAFVLTQYWYQIYVGFSGQKFILEAASQTYNIVSTGCSDCTNALWKGTVIVHGPTDIYGSPHLAVGCV